MKIQSRFVFSAWLVVVLVSASGSPAQAFGGCLLEWIESGFDHHFVCGAAQDNTCVAYTVQDTGQAASTILRIDLRDPNTGDEFFRLTPLRNCATCDIEALAVDLSTGRLFGIAGGDGTATAPLPQAGELFEINRQTGAFTIIGPTGATGAAEIVAASFRPADGSLWAFQETVGLVSVNLSNGARTLEFAVGGVADQNGDPIGDNWEGIAWNNDGTFLYGAQDTRLYRWDPSTGDVHRVCANIGTAGAMVEALEFTPDGRLIGSSNLPSSDKLLQIGFPEDESNFGASACGLTQITLPSGAMTNDLESIAFESCDTVPFACATARPRALVFEYTGESCLATNNNQGGHLFCLGNPNGAQPVKVEVLLGASAVPSSQTVNVGDEVAIVANGNFLPNVIWITIKQGLLVKRQKLAIDTSCNERLEVGDQFGSLILRQYIPGP